MHHDSISNVETVETNDSNKPDITKGNEQKGAEFMALRANVREKRRELRKDLTPSQNYLLDDITEYTVNGWSSTKEFDLDQLATGLGYKTTDKIYLLLKQLHKKGLIIRKPTKYAKREILGLNPKVFGQVLINHQHETEKRKHLKLLPQLTKQESTTYEAGVNDLQSVSQSLTDHKLKLDQPIEIIKENRPIDSYRSLQISLDENSDEFLEEKEAKKRLFNMGFIKEMPR